MPLLRASTVYEDGGGGADVASCSQQQINDYNGWPKGRWNSSASGPRTTVLTYSPRLCLHHYIENMLVPYLVDFVAEL
eukprot:1818713-Pyramimonas_sp.AAC.1